MVLELGKYNIVNFPPSNFPDNVFTYELQKYFENQQNNNTAFRGYIEDLVKINEKLQIEFSCIIRNKSIIDPTVIIFRLEVDEKQVNELMNNDRPDSMDTFETLII